MRKPILNAFEEFVKATFSKEVSELPIQQLEQLKMAFYGGAVVTENLISNEILNGSEVSSAKIIFTIQNELIEYGKQFEH